MEITDYSDYVKSPYWKLIAQEDLPYLPTPIEVIEYVFDYLTKHYKIQSPMKLIDLGAGDGRIIIYASEKYGLHTLGVEINESFIQAANFEINRRNLTAICCMEEADLYAQRLGAYDIIWTFMIPTSHKYFKHVIETVKSGGLVVAIRWPLDTFQKMWNYIEILNPLDQFPVYIYVKK